MALVKVECIECGGKYFVDTNTQNVEIPQNIKQGEAFPSHCPVWRDGNYAVLPEKE